MHLKSAALREEHSLRCLRKRMPRRIFGRKREEAKEI
jgi:hypothetical protein